MSVEKVASNRHVHFIKRVLVKQYIILAVRIAINAKSNKKDYKSHAWTSWYLKYIICIYFVN